MRGGFDLPLWIGGHLLAGEEIKAPKVEQIFVDLGLNGDEVIHCFIDVMNAGAPYTVIQQAVHIHPTVTELIPTMLGDLKPLA